MKKLIIFTSLVVLTMTGNAQKVFTLNGETCVELYTVYENYDQISNPEYGKQALTQIQWSAEHTWWQKILLPMIPSS